jgi:hypothetical protein
VKSVKVGNINVNWPSVKQYMEGDLIVLAMPSTSNDPKFLFAASYYGDNPFCPGESEYMHQDWVIFSGWTGMTEQDLLDADTLMEFESDGVQYIIKFVEA